jgi:dTDP-glucose 4,6-dehydratase
MTEKIVVLGSNSFSGSHFVKHCLDQDLCVAGISRSEEPHSVFLPYKKSKNQNFEFYQLDLNKDLPEILEVIKRFRPDYVVNFAAQGMVAESWQNPDHWFRTNTLANVMLHDGLRKFDFIRKYVHISTPEVYGSCSGLVPENTNYNPSTPYAVSRAAADLSLMSFYKAYKFPVVFTRAANVYGPGQQLYRIIPRTVLSILTGQKLPLHGGGHSVRSFIHIEDVARGTLMVARNAAPGEIFHFSTTENISIRKLVEQIVAMLGARFEDCVDIAEERLGKDAFYLLDSSKAKSLGWRDEVSLAKGLENTIQWAKENIDILSSLPIGYVHKP